MGVRNPRSVSDCGDIGAPRSMRRRATDRLVAFVIPYDDEQILRLLIAESGENAEIEHHAAVGIERDNAAVRQTDRKSERLRCNAAELLLKKARSAHMRGGVVPFIDACAERQHHQFVLELARQDFHAVEAVHRTTLPASTTAA